YGGVWAEHEADAVRVGPLPSGRDRYREAMLLHPRKNRTSGEEGNVGPCTRLMLETDVSGQGNRLRRSSGEHNRIRLAQSDAWRRHRDVHISRQGSLNSHRA